MPFDGIAWPKITVLAAFGGTTDPGTGYLHLGVGPGLGTGMLGGPTFFDITDDVRSISIKRGRDSDIDLANPGTCALVLDNFNGRYDSTSLNTPFWSPNLLTVQQESLEDGTTSGWQAGQDTSIANTAAQSYHGAKALQLTKTVGTGTAFAQAGVGITGVPFPASTPCRASVWFRTAVTGRQCKIRVAFHTLTGTYLSGQDLLSDAVTDTTSGWTQAIVTGMSPAQATRIVPELQIASAVLNEVHYADEIRIEQGGPDIGAPVKVRVEWPLGTVINRFVGQVADIAPDLGNDPTVTFTCADGLEQLGRADLATVAPTFDGDTTGARIGHLADQAGWPTSLRALDAGYTPLGPTALGDFALNLMRKVEQTEFGLLYADASGALVFYDRHRATTATRSVNVQASFADSPANSLLGDTSTFEAGLGGWVNSSNSTPTQSTAQAHSGSGSMRLSSVASGDMEAKHVSDGLLATNGVPVGPGNPYTISAWFRADATASSRTCQVRVSWYDTGGVNLLATNTGTSVTDSTSAWIQSTGTFVAPTSAAIARVRVRVQATGGIAELHYVDDVVFSGNEIEMASLQAAKSRERLYNDTHITRDPSPLGGDSPVEQIATNAESTARYGTLSLPVQVGAQHRDDYQCLAMAQYLTNRYSWPEPLRVRELTVDAITQGLWSVLLPLDLLDRISVSRDYGPATVTAQLLIQAFSEEIRMDPDAAWTMMFTTSQPPPSPDLWVLGTSAIGSGRLGW